MDGNPFALPDATSYYLSANKSLADIANTEAQARFHTEQAKALERAAKTDEDTKNAMARAVAEDTTSVTSPFSTGGAGMPGVTGQDKGSGPLSILGQAPTFTKQFELAAKYDNLYRKLAASRADPKVVEHMMKQRDEQLSKGIDDQRAWVEAASKNIDNINQRLDGITDAPTYNAVMAQLVRQQGPGVVEMLGLPPSLTQEQWANDPQYQDTIKAVVQRGYDVKTRINEAHLKVQEDLTRKRDAAMAEDRRLDNIRADQRLAWDREKVAADREDRARKQEAEDEQKQIVRAERVQRSLDQAPEVKKFQAYNQAMGQVDDIRSKIYGPDGKLIKNWYTVLTPADALQLKTSFSQMSRDFKDSYSTVYGEKQLNSMTGMLQKADAYLSTIGEGSKQWDEGTIKEVTETMKKTFNLANTAVIKKDLEAIRALDARKGDPEQLALKGDYDRFFRENYNAKDPVNSFIAVKESDGKYYMRFGKGDKAELLQITKRIYNYARPEAK